MFWIGVILVCLWALFIIITPDDISEQLGMAVMLSMYTLGVYLVLSLWPLV